MSHTVTSTANFQASNLQRSLHVSITEPFDTIVSVSKVRYFRQKVLYQYSIGIVIPGSGKYQYSISI